MESGKRGIPKPQKQAAVRATMTMPRVVLVFLLLLWFCLYHCNAQISQEQCYSCVSDGCQYCTGGSDSSSSNNNNDAAAGDDNYIAAASSFYCECDADVYSAKLACFATESHCDLALDGLFSLALGALLLPCICGCALLGTCIYCCCQRKRGDYYVEAADDFTPHYGTQQPPAPPQHYAGAAAIVHVPHANNSNAAPFSQALG